MPHPTRPRSGVTASRRVFFAEDRYLPPHWHNWTDDIDGLIQIRTTLIDAYRSGQVRPADIDAVSARVEWVDARIGWLTRQERARQREAVAVRVRAAIVVLLMVVVAAVVFVSFDAPTVLLWTCGVALIIAVVVLALNIRSPEVFAEGTTGESHLADL